MKENNKNYIYYLEQNKNICNLTFDNEVNSLEFVQKIGNKELLNDYKKRDLFLRKLGKQLFRKFKNGKPENIHKLSIKIKRELRLLTKKDIDCMLTARNYKIKLFDRIKMFYRDLSEWKIVVSKNNIVYKFSLKGIEKNDYNKTIKYADLEADYIFDGGVFSQEEINELLTSIEKTDE
jgi:hypothetical protein